MEAAPHLHPPPPPSLHTTRPFTQAGVPKPPPAGNCHPRTGRGTRTCLPCVMSPRIQSLRKSGGEGSGKTRKLRDGGGIHAAQDTSSGCRAFPGQTVVCIKAKSHCTWGGEALWGGTPWLGGEGGRKVSWKVPEGHGVLNLLWFCF